jgi:hypothetical protein
VNGRYIWKVNGRYIWKANFDSNTIT